MSSQPLCASCVLSGLAVSFFASDAVSVPSVRLRLRVCRRACACAQACIVAPGRGRGSLFGWQTCPVVVIVPEAASGTIWPLWKTSAGATSEQACKSGKKKKKIKKRAKELRMSREEPEPWDQETGNGFLIEAWRRINPAALFKQKKGNGFSKNVLREYILMEAFSVRH